MNVGNILNSTPLYIGVIAALLFVFFTCIVYLTRASKRAIELGFTSEDIRGIIKSSVIFSIVPSLSIVLALFSLASVLGIPWSWFRLSVVGSLSYELMAADMAATGSGISSLGEFINSDNIQSVTNIFLVMSIGIMGGILMNALLGEKVQSKIVHFQERNAEWGALAISYFMLTLVAVFLPIQLTQSIVHFATLITSGLITVLHVYIIKKFNIKWLNEFVLANALILGMISSVFWTKILL